MGREAGVMGFWSRAVGGMGAGRAEAVVGWIVEEGTWRYETLDS